MSLLHNDPELHLIVWRAEERALLARAEVRRQLGRRPSRPGRWRAATLRTVGALLVRCGQWLRESNVEFAAGQSTSR